MPSQMTSTQIERFITSMQDQGVGITRTKKGLFLRLPDGASTTVHFTTSDVRAAQNLIAILRRSGVRHPEDPRNVAHLPDSITQAVVAQRSKDKIMQFVVDVDYPEFVRVLDIAAKTGMVHITISRTLHAMGFIPIMGKRNARDWKTPEEILAMKPESTTIQDENQEPGLLDRELERVLRLEEEEADRFGQIQEEQKKAGLSRLSDDLDFIDERDSWVVPLERLIGRVLWSAVEDRFQILDVLGMDYEVRVWRR